jgi:UDP-N-acetylglucosamine 4-epimerase
MNRILVTGGAGFIGSNLCEHLLANNYEVVCLDNFSTGHMDNIQDFLDNYPTRFTLIEGDIRNLETCFRAVDGVDSVLHEAALGSIPRSIENPIVTNDVNVNGFLNMLIAARDYKVKRFVFAASSSTYGDNVELPKVEERIGKPLSPYALTKYVNELYAEVFAKTYGIEYIGLRYFNVFGRRQDPDGMYAAVIPLFIKQYINHQRPIINGDGTHTRDFTYIDNVIHMNILALETTRKESINQIYNVAGGEQTSINELSEHIKFFLSEYDSSILDILPIYKTNRQGDISHSLASIAKAKEGVGYVPRVAFIDGLKATVSWYLDKFRLIQKDCIPLGKE